MEDRRTIPLSLGAGETRRLLLEAGSTVLVLSGQLVWRDPDDVAASIAADIRSAAHVLRDIISRDDP